jgi:hypothetical protein
MASFKVSVADTAHAVAPPSTGATVPLIEPPSKPMNEKKPVTAMPSANKLNFVFFIKQHDLKINNI